jgi:hypothetical protein
MGQTLLAANPKEIFVFMLNLQLCRRAIYIINVVYIGIGLLH